MFNIKKALAVLLGLATLSATPVEATYVDAVNNLNPIRYYRFEDVSTASGQPLDDIGLGNDDTTYGASTSSLTGPVIGVPNTAVNGGGALIGTGSMTSDLPGSNADMSFMFWFRRSSDAEGALLGYGTANGRAVYFNDLAIPLRAGERGKNEVFTGDLDLNKWYFATVTIEGVITGEWRIYVAELGDSAVSLATGPNLNGNGNSSNNAPLTMGGADQFLSAPADLDELAVFDYALSESDINDVWAAANQGGESAHEFSWINLESGNWIDSANWAPAGGPPGISAGFENQSAVFGDVIPSPKTVVSDTAVSVRAITFNSQQGYAIAGRGSLTLVEGTQVGSADPPLPDLTGPSSITVGQGEQEFQLPVNLENDTTVDVASGQKLSFHNALNLMGNTLTKTGAGTMAVNNKLHTAGGTIDVLEGTVSGDGTFGGNVNNNGGTLSPGNSPGVMTIEGNLAQDGTILMELAGTAAGTEHDVLAVGGTVTLGGNLEVSLLDGFQPENGDSFNIFDFGSLTGEFDNVLLPALSAGLAWDDSALLNNGSLSVVPEPGSVVLCLLGLIGAAGLLRPKR